MCCTGSRVIGPQVVGMEAATAISLSQWLFALDHVSSVVPATVRIARRTFAAARYTQDFEGQVAEKLYLDGELPPLYRRSQHICFRTDDEERDWFLTSWYRRVAGAQEYDEVFRYGDHTILTYYSPLETWASRQTMPRLRRLKMTITEVGPALTNTIQPTEE